MTGLGVKGNKAAVPALDIAMGSRSGAGAGREDREGLSPEGSPQVAGNCTDSDCSLPKSGRWGRTWWVDGNLCRRVCSAGRGGSLD